MSSDIEQGDVIAYCERYAERIALGEAAPFHGTFSDPPYCLDFMGSGQRDAPHREYARQNPGQVAQLANFLGLAEWEAAAVLWYKAVAGAVLACVLPGAPLLWCAGSRTDDLLAIGLRAAGWDVRDKLIYLYGSGMPHGLDISKALDDGAGAVREDAVSGGHIGWGGAAGDVASADGQVFGDLIPHVVNRGSLSRGTPATEEAQRWQGYNTALKPAYETLIYALAPFPGTYAGAALAFGTSGLNIDAGRVGLAGERAPTGSGNRRGSRVYGRDKRIFDERVKTPDAGRYPANVLLQHADGCELRGISPDGMELVEDWLCEPGCPVATLDAQSGETRSSDAVDHGETRSTGAVYGLTGYRNRRKRSTGYKDAGGASRFFYTSKAAAWEREAGLDGMPIFMQQRTNPGGLENEPRWAPKPTRNPHPTLKSIRALTYLLKLIGRPPHIASRLFTPFCGVGSEVIAALLAGWQHVTGVELDQDERYPGAFVPIARARLAWWSQFSSYEEARLAAEGERIYAAETAAHREAGQLFLFE